jgi:hypothetical protein
MCCAARPGVLASSARQGPALRRATPGRGGPDGSALDHVVIIETRMGATPPFPTRGQSARAHALRRAWRCQTWVHSARLAHRDISGGASQILREGGFVRPRAGKRRLSCAIIRRSSQLTLIGCGTLPLIPKQCCGARSAPSNSALNLGARCPSSVSCACRAARRRD